MFSYYKKWYLPALFLLIGCAEAKDNCGFIMTEWGEHASHKNIPVHMLVNDKIPAKYHRTIQDSMTIWNESFGKQLFVIDGLDTRPVNPTEDKRNVVYFVSDWNDSVAKQGAAQVHLIGDRINDADVVINIRDFSYYTGPVGEPNMVNLESLLVHELGHVLGLAHGPKGSVMFPYLDYNELRYIPSVMDINNLKCEY